MARSGLLLAPSPSSLRRSCLRRLASFRHSSRGRGLLGKPIDEPTQLNDTGGFGASHCTGRAAFAFGSLAFSLVRACRRRRSRRRRTDLNARAPSVLLNPKTRADSSAHEPNYKFGSWSQDKSFFCRSSSFAFFFHLAAATLLALTPRPRSRQTAKLWAPSGSPRIPARRYHFAAPVYAPGSGSKKSRFQPRRSAARACPCLLAERRRRSAKGNERTKGLVPKRCTSPSNAVARAEPDRAARRMSRAPFAGSLFKIR
jgi:hypothetical protein